MNNLKKLRRAKGVSQQEVATYLKVSSQAYSNYENEKREADYETLLKLADYFDVTLDYLLCREEKSIQPTEEEIKYALFDGEQGISDEAYNEVKQFAAFIKERFKDDKTE